MAKRKVRSSRPPLWALLVVAHECATHGRRAPRVTWYWGASRYSSGHAKMESATIHVSAGIDVTDQQLVLLHELAHYLTKPRCGKKRAVWHSTRFWSKAWELFQRYGDDAFIEYARKREGSYKKRAAAMAPPVRAT